MISNEAMKIKASRLESAINLHRGESVDVEFLATYPALTAAIRDAKMGRNPKSRDLGLSRWIFESRIQDFEDIAEALAEFSLLLRGL